MTNSTPWQTLINTNNTPAFPLTKNNLTAVKKTENKQKGTKSALAKTIVMKSRYSFDDNGGSYMGL